MSKVLDFPIHTKGALSLEAARIAKKDKRFSRFMRKVLSLDHISVSLKSGGRVLLLDTGAKLGPEEVAMIQALYSRDPGTVLEHLKKIEEEGAEKFMAKFYVGYGHQSIGDCGAVALFIEGVSMPCAKAIQDYMLYAGQEVSTRYVDFSEQPFITSGLLEGWSERFRAFYVYALPVMVAHLKDIYPHGGSESFATWERAINARAFDSLRGFLPAGASTSVSWYADLRKAREHMAQLRNHLLPEVREVGLAIESALLSGHPSSFADPKVTDRIVPKRYFETEKYIASYMRDEYYFTAEEGYPEFYLVRNDVALCERVKRVASQRPRHAELPKALAEYGTMQFAFMIDFASFRDIQRQRSVIQRMPLLTIDHGFHAWYMDQLPDELRVKAWSLIELLEIDMKKVLSFIEPDPQKVLLWRQDAPFGTEPSSDELCSFGPDPEKIAMLQYDIPMGYRVPQRITGDLPALVYIAELRTSQTVHPTLRAPAQKIAREIERQFGIPIYADYEPDRFSVKRGDQTILKK